MSECAYVISTATGRLGQIGGLEVAVPGDGLYSAAKQWARITCKRLVDFQPHHPGGYSVAVLEDADGTRQVVHVDFVRSEVECEEK